MMDIRHPHELQDWLAERPQDWSQVIAARAALRILPYAIADAKWASENRLPISVFRAAAISWAALNYPAYDMNRAASAAARAATHATNTSFEAARTLGLDGGENVAIAVSNAAEVVVISATFAPRDAADAAARVAELVDNALFAIVAAAFDAEAIVAAFWRAISADLSWLDSRKDSRGAARALTRRALWPNGTPASWEKDRRRAQKTLLQVHPTFGVWTHWYRRRIQGARAAFEIPGDKGRIEDKWLLRQLSDATERDFWDHGEGYVNRQLIEWLEEARERAAMNFEPAGSKHNGPILSDKLRAAASPQAAEREGKLDAGPNALFDQPTYSGDLADLPSAMRSFIKILLNSLGENASTFMRSSLEGYHEELELRGTQPIVGTLKGLAQAISREIWTSQSLVASDDPDDWEMRDEREWGAGMGDLFRTFAKYNADLVKHFPLDKEREDLLRATPIDEMAASGTALTEPVALVTGLVRDLHAQGMATDNILKIMDAHAQYNRDIASMPPLPANLPVDYVTAKRRHVLMTAGFYLHLYSVMGSTASLAPAYSALGTMFWNAAQSLLAFVR